VRSHLSNVACLVSPNQRVLWCSDRALTALELTPGNDELSEDEKHQIPLKKRFKRTRKSFRDLKRHDEHLLTPEEDENEESDEDDEDDD
jgi:hypothetical protein